MPLPSDRNRGFSLLELILVLVIIGVMLAVITISISDRRGDQLGIEAQRFQLLIQMAQDDAVMTNQELGLILDKEGYRFVHFDDGDWRPLDETTAVQFRPRRLPEGVTYKIQVAGLYGEQEVQSLTENTDTDGSSEEDSKFRDAPDKPQILMLSSAEVTPFVVRLGYDDEQPVYYEIKTLINGQLEMTGPVYEPMILDWGIPQ